MEKETEQLNFSSVPGPWPLAAHKAAAMFVFTGSFDRGRIEREAAARLFNRLLTWGLVVIAGIGGVAFVWSAWHLGYDELDGWFLFRHHWYNVFFWIGSLAGLYVWADRLHAAAEYEVTRVLSPVVVVAWAKRKSPIDVYHLFTAGSRTVWNGTLKIARDSGAGAPSTYHIFMSLLEHESIKLVFVRFGINPGRFKTDLDGFLKQSPDAAEQELVAKLPFVALDEALKLRNRSVDPLMLLCGLATVLPPEHPIAKLFFNIELSYDKLEIIAAWIFNMDLLAADDKLFRKLARHKSDSGINRGLTAVPTPYLDQFSQDLTIAAKYHHLPLARGRDDEVDKIITLFGQGKSVLVKGAVGTGRSTIVNHLAFRMASEQVPVFLQDKRLIRLEIAAILGSKVPAEQALLNVFREAEHSGNIVFAIENVDQMAKATGAEGLSLLEVLASHLQNSSALVIATTTPEAYQSALRSVANFDERFATYELTDLSPEAIMLASCVRASIFEGSTGAFFQYQAIEEAVKLTDQYFKDKGQPEKAIEVLKEAAQSVKNLSGKDKLVTPKVIQTILAEKTHVPTSAFTQSEADKLLHLEDEISKYLVGQKEAVVAVAEALRRARSGLTSSTRPLGSFLFIGPTGVGKTELAKTLAKVYFGDDRYFLRLDMSEYQGSDGLRKLIGSAEGTDSTPFITHLKTYPFCLFLLDEMEKASPDILNLFLQVLDDARITTGGGKTLDLTHTVIIATSNAGTPEIQAGITAGKSLDDIKAELLSTILIHYYRPEFLNRFDGVILFRPLEHSEVESITRLQLQAVSAQLLAKGIKLQFSDAVVTEIATKAFDPLLGGRPIRRFIQDHVESVLAKLMLSKQLERGAENTLDINEAGEYVVK